MLVSNMQSIESELISGVGCALEEVVLGFQVEATIRHKSKMRQEAFDQSLSESYITTSDG